MKTLELAAAAVPRTAGELLDLASDDGVIIRTPDGRSFYLTELGEDQDVEDFADEIALTRRNKALMALLAERSKEPGEYTLDEVRARLGWARS